MAQPASCGADVYHDHHPHSTNYITRSEQSILLADASVLFGDCGEAGTTDAACAVANAILAADNAVPVRQVAYRDPVLVSAGERLPAWQCPATNMQVYDISARRGANAVTRARAVSQAYAAQQYQGEGRAQNSIRGNSVRNSAAPGNVPAQDGNVDQQAASGHYYPATFAYTNPPSDNYRGLNQYEMYSLECEKLGMQIGEPRPIPGVTIPRTSIGLGHPSGDITNIVPRDAPRGAECDLSPLLPGTLPANQYVMNPPDGDHYHRTSVFAASGVPMDMPAYSGTRSWAERIQHSRT